MLSYGIAVQALIYPGFYAPVRSFIWAVIFQPFMEVLGDPRLDEIGASNEDICDSDSNAPWPYVSCPNVKNTFFALALKLFYMIFTNALLLNLLIAIFNNRYQQVNEKSKLYWKCNLYSIMQDYYDRQKLHFFCFFSVQLSELPSFVSDLFCHRLLFSFDTLLFLWSTPLKKIKCAPGSLKWKKLNKFEIQI